MSETEKPRKEKKTNYQRLWRNAKKAEVLNHNFAEGVIQAANRVMKDKNEKSTFNSLVAYMRNNMTKALSKIT